MDAEKCVSLHNEILRHGWIGSGKSPESFETNCPTWFDYYGADAEAIRPKLTPKLIEFLEHARVSISQNPSQVSFFYWVDDLVYPTGLLEDIFMEHLYESELDGNEGSKTRYVFLYMLNDLGSHRMGLLFDQETHLSILCPTLWDISTVFNGRIAWYPFETALGVWVDMIRQGVVEAIPRELRDDTLPDYFHPWALMEYSNFVLEETVTTFNKLVGAIETRLPTASATDPNHIRYGLVDENTLRGMKLPQKFLYEFLQRARRPQFKMIAPGLEVPTSSSFSAQPFWPRLVRPRYRDDAPLLLFQSKRNYVDSFNASTIEDDHPFGDFSEMSTFPAGLYFIPGDTIKFVLPFGIGSSGYARMSDGSRFGENTEDKEVKAEDKYSDLYQRGGDPFTTHQKNNLLRVLRSWLGMVERGDWKIDQHGVAGGMDVWREADTEHGWAKYMIPLVEM